VNSSNIVSKLEILVLTSPMDLRTSSWQEVDRRKKGFKSLVQTCWYRAAE